MRKTLLILLIIIGITAIFLNFSKRAPDLDSNTQSAKYLMDGPYDVRKETRQLVDVSRTIAKNGDFEGAPQRAFDVTFWSPKTKLDSPQPLLIYSHGFLSSAKGGSYLGEHLASHGYTVAAATYPLTNFYAPGSANVADVVNQPADLSFIIDTLLQMNDDSKSARYQTIDKTKIAAAGLSLGGLTTTLAAFHPQHSDSRIAAAISIAGPAYMFSKRFFAHNDLPFMMIAAPNDAIIRHAENASNLLEKSPNALLLNIQTASHAGFSSTAQWLRWFNNPDSLGCDTITSNEHFNNQGVEISLGSPEMGILELPSPPICEMDPLPKAMNPLRQHQLTTLAVSGFLECHFERERLSNIKSCNFLNTTLANEIDEIELISGAQFSL